jgi:hypothetical protein
MKQIGKWLLIKIEIQILTNNKHTCYYIDLILSKSYFENNSPKYNTWKFNL